MMATIRMPRNIKGIFMVMMITIWARWKKGKGQRSGKKVGSKRKAGVVVVGGGVKGEGEKSSCRR